MQNSSKFGETLTQERLKYFLEYSEDTGLFTWRFNRRGLNKGDVAGNKSDAGYICIRIDKRLYRAHRLAWLYVYGEWPEDCIDHINHKRDDNRISNLRQSTKSENSKNLSMRSDNSTGITGVHWYKAYSKWSAEIWYNGKKYFLGYFDTIQEAAKVRADAEESFCFDKGHGK